MEKEYMLTIYGENKVGLINRICTIFTQRHINIENFTASETEINNVFKFTLVVKSEKEILEKIINQLEKLIDVHRAFVHEEDEVLFQEMALYKISTQSLLNNSDLENIIRANNARILSITPDYFVIERTGYSEEIKFLLNQLEPYGIIEFSKSGRVAIVKWSRNFHDHLKQLSKEKEVIYTK